MKKNIIPYILLFTLFISCNKQVNTERLTDFKIKIFKDQETKKGYLIFDENIDNWTLLYNDSIVLSGSNKVNDTIAIPNRAAKHEIYTFSINDHQVEIAEEHLPMSGGYNFRDLGGIKTKDGRSVKWGKIIRSDDLFKLTDADLSYLNTFPLKTVVDFRAENEIEIAPDRLPASTNTHDLLSISPGNILEFVNQGNIDPVRAAKVMEQLNIGLVSDSSSISQYQKFFELLQNSNDIPLLFHCSAGKDRTGMGAALILSALGVSEDIIFDDYLKSNIFLADKYKVHKEKYPAMVPFFEVRKEYLKAGLDEIKSKYGSVDNYLVNTLNVDTTSFRQYFLYND